MKFFSRRKTAAGRHPTKADAFAKLKAMRVPVGAVLDVGVKTCTAELLQAWPDRPHVLMEPVIEWNEAIRRNYDAHGTSYEIINAAISDSDGEVTLKTTSVYADAPISHSKMVETGDGPDHRTVPMRALDSIVAERDLRRPFLLKIDVDGAEMSVLAGAQNTLAGCSIVVIEASIVNLIERARALQRAGFQLFDIVDLSYYDDRFVQADMIFLSKKTIRKRGLEIYRDGFDIAKWRVYAPK